MRWIWIDKFTEFTTRTSATAVKNVSLAEEHLHDLYPAFPIVPHSLIVEGMAQTAGILVGEARNFEEKVILAKIGKATFHRLVRPGETIEFAAKIDQLNEQGASISGTVKTPEELDLLVSELKKIECFKDVQRGPTEPGENGTKRFHLTIAAQCMGGG